jgi:hypothetical protein
MKYPDGLCSTRTITRQNALDSTILRCEDFLFKNSSTDTRFFRNQQYKPYSDIIEYSYSKCFSIGLVLLGRSSHE